MLSQSQVDIVKATVPVIRDHGRRVTDVFYHNVLKDYPSLNALFNQANQASGQQSQALANAVLTYATHIDRLDVLRPAISHISNKHASLFVKPEQYNVVGKYLLDAFAECLDDAFTSETRDAWTAAYGQLAAIMIGTEEELYKQVEDWSDWRDFVVKKKTPESSEITSFALYPADGKPLTTYQPGQYISIRVLVPELGYTQIRQYSLSDSHTTDHFRISVKRDPGFYKDDTIAHPGLVSNTLHRVVVEGDVVQLSPPRGEFILDNAVVNSTDPLVLISAGVGLTPMMSMLNTALVNNIPSRPICWIHGANTSQKRAFADRIDQVARANDNVRITRFLSQVTANDKVGIAYDRPGRVDLNECDAEKDLFISDKSTQYYVCGPAAFMSAIQEQLARLGVDGDRVRSERFSVGGS